MGTMHKRVMSAITHDFVDHPQGEAGSNQCEDDADELVDGFALGLSIHGDSFAI